MADFQEYHFEQPQQEQNQNQQYVDDTEVKKETVKVSDVIDTTLDEPVHVTLWRELKQVGIKLFHVVIFCTKTERVLKDWDLWGPMFICYALSLLLSISSMIRNNDTNDDQDISSYVFSIVFILFWLGSIVISLNTKFLGGKLSITQSICVIGYCVFPIFLGAVITTITTFIYDKSTLFIGIPVMVLCDVWSCMASFGFLQSAIKLSRRLLAVYPIVLFFTMLSWLTLLVNLTSVTETTSSASK
ncbi:Protein YIPF [Entamoeba marina]